MGGVPVLLRFSFSWSLYPPCGICCSAPNICSSKPWFRKLLPLGSGEAETGDPRGRDGGVREELAAGVAPMTNHHHEEPAPLSALVWAVVFTILLVAAVAVFALVLSR